MTLRDPEIAAVLLAAGASSRMGRPKPLLEFEGETFLDRQIAAMTGVCEQVFVVLGHAADQIAAGAARTENALLLLNPQPERGQLSSLQCGLRALPAHIRAVFFQPVDGPGAKPETLRAMMAAWRGAGGERAFVIPRHEGRNGHPVLMNASLVREVLSLPETASAREVVHAHRAASLYLDIDDFACFATSTRRRSMRH